MSYTNIIISKPVEIKIRNEAKNTVFLLHSFLYQFKISIFAGMPFHFNSKEVSP